MKIDQDILARRMACSFSRNHPARGQTGLTLPELLIALTLGLLLVAGIVTIFSSSRQAYRVQDENARIQEAGRHALEVIGRSLRQAGYPHIQFNSSSQFVNRSTTALRNAAYLFFTVEYVSPGPGTVDCAGSSVSEGSLVQKSFYIGQGVLYCGTQPLIDNVADFKVIYGMDTNRDQSVDRYVLGSSGHWAERENILSARVCLVIRSHGQNLATGNQTYLNCNGALGVTPGSTTTAPDTRLYRTFVGTYALRNRLNSPL